MSENSDYFFLNIKQIYPNFLKPSSLDEEIWEGLLSGYEKEDILRAIKDYRLEDKNNIAPNPARLKEYLRARPKPKDETEGDYLPPNPAVYLMRRDTAAGCCHHFFPTYSRAVDYLLNEKLATFYPKEEFKDMSYGERYRLAVEKGLFADFNKALDLVWRRFKGIKDENVVIGKVF